MKPNLRDLLNVSGEYHTYNREERYYAAILFHFLLKKSELKKFLDKYFSSYIGIDYDLKKVKVFFEYSHVRDLWATVKKESKESNVSIDILNSTLRKAIYELLNPPEILGLSNLKVDEFNKFFGAKSKTEVQMPGRWSKDTISKWAKEEAHNSNEFQDFAQRVCRLIWAFNAKADIVIHVDEHTAICIEAKVISPESKYRADLKNVFTRTQTQIQEFILTELLGYKTTFAFLSNSGNFKDDSLNSPSFGMCWEHIFALMESTTDELDFVKDSIKSKVIIDNKKNKENK